MMNKQEYIDAIQEKIRLIAPDGVNHTRPLDVVNGLSDAHTIGLNCNHNNIPLPVKYTPDRIMSLGKLYLDIHPECLGEVTAFCFRDYAADRSKNPIGVKNAIEEARLLSDLLTDVYGLEYGDDVEYLLDDSPYGEEAEEIWLDAYRNRDDSEKTEKAEKTFGVGYRPMDDLPKHDL